MNALERGSTLIAAKELKFAGRRYRPADKFDYKRLGIAHRRTVRSLMDGISRKVVELTPETFAEALRFRDPEAGPPRGFSLSILVQMGIMTWAQIAERGWDKRNQNEEVTDENADPKAWEAPKGSWKVFAEGADEEKATDDTTLWVVPFKTGGAPRYFVHDLNGENLNGASSIGGKAKAEEWARNFMKERAARALAGREGDPDWSGFPENPDDWSDDQVEIFDAWYDALQPGVEVTVEHAAVQKLYEERVEAAQQNENDGTDNTPGERADGLTTAEATELLEAMTDDELIDHVAALTGKDRDSLKDLTALALREMALEEQPPEGSENDGDVQPESGD